MVEVGGRYRHYKGNKYEVIALAKDSDTLIDVVVYQGLYGDHPVWVRPLKEFEEQAVSRASVVVGWHWPLKKE